MIENAEILYVILKENVYMSLSEHSMEHLLDTLIKVQLMCCSYHHILDPIIT